MTSPSVSWLGTFAGPVFPLAMRPRRGGVLVLLRRSRGDSSGRLLAILIGASSLVAGLLVAELLQPGMLSGLLGASALDVRHGLLAGSVAGFLVTAAAVGRARGSAPAAVAGGRRLCTAGPFAHSRNPLALSFILPLAAIGGCSVPAAALAVLMYVLVMTHLVIRDEERAMRSTFGRDFEEYQRRVPRWLLG